MCFLADVHKRAQPSLTGSGQTFAMDVNLDATTAKDCDFSKRHDNDNEGGNGQACLWDR